MILWKSHHIALRTPNFNAMKAFYTETLGMKVLGNIRGSQTCFIDIGGTTIELSPMEPFRMGLKPTQGLAHLAFQVDDVDAAYQKLVAKGIQFHITPRGNDFLRVAFFRDPDGNDLELFHSAALYWK
ncbi:MAG: VOC family protein [Chloroflexota bacterium]